MANYEREREREGGGEKRERERETCLLATQRVGLRTYKVQNTCTRWQECCIFISSPSLAVAMRAHMPQAVFGWFNPLPLGSISAFGSIANLALNSTSLINYQEIIRSI